MNQGNLNVNQNNGVNNPQVVNNGMNQNINSAPVKPIPQVQPTQQQVVSTPQIKPTQVNTVQVPNTTQKPVVNPSVQTINPNKQVQNNNSVVTPTQTIINTGNKKTISIVWFLLVILMGVFIYYIDDILAYFNQNFTPVVKEDTLSETGSANLVDGFIKIDTTNSYIKVKSIRFNNVKKGDNNAIFISYLSDKNYSAALPLGIVIEFYDQNKEKIYEEDFNVFGSIESSKTRQYKISLEEKKYNNAYYCLIKTK